MRLRFAFALLLAAILSCGVGQAALRSATGWWASGVFTATLSCLASAAVYAVHRRGPRRAFWSAFVALGSDCMLLAFCPGCETSIRPRLLTARPLDVLAPIVHPAGERAIRPWDVADPESLDVADTPPGGPATVTGTPTPVRRHFQDV